MFGQKPLVCRAARHDPNFGFPSEGKAIQFAAGCLTVRTPTCPRCAACTDPSPLLPHAVVVSLLTAGVKGASPMQLFLFLVFLSPEKEKRVGGEAIIYPLSEI